MLAHKSATELVDFSDKAVKKIAVVADHDDCAIKCKNGFL